jgi:hypothetical protein
VRRCVIARLVECRSLMSQTPPYYFQKANSRAKAHVCSCGTLPLLVYCEADDPVDPVDPERYRRKDYFPVASSFVRGARHAEESYNCGAQRHTHGELSLIAEWRYSEILVSKLYCAVSVDRKPCYHKDKGRYTIQLGLGISIEIRNDIVCREITGSTSTGATRQRATWADAIMQTTERLQRSEPVICAAGLYRGQDLLFREQLL